MLLQQACVPSRVQYMFTATRLGFQMLRGGPNVNVLRLYVVQPCLPLPQGSVGLDL